MERFENEIVFYTTLEIVWINDTEYVSNHM